MAATAAASRPRRRGPTLKQASKPISSYDPETEQVRHRKLTDSEARNFAAALPLDTDPDTVEHPQVRRALVDRFSDIDRGGNVREFPGRGEQPALPPPLRHPFSAAGNLANRRITTVAGHSLSVASFLLGLVGWAVARNIIDGTFTQWFAAKTTNGRGSLP